MLLVYRFGNLCRSSYETKEETSKAKAIHHASRADCGYVIDILPNGLVRIADELTIDYQLTDLSLIFEFDPRTVVNIVVLSF